MPDRYFQHTFPNGLTLLAERMPGMQSAAMTLLVPAGVSADPDGQVGASTVLSDLVLRGAGKLDSRALTDHLDRLGLQRSSTVGLYHTRFGAAALAARVLDALPTYADILTKPHLPEDGFESARDLTLQALAGVDDEPQQKLMIKLREQHFAHPWNRNTMGETTDLGALTLDQCKAVHARGYRAKGAILALAGDVDFASVTTLVGDLFAHLPPGDNSPLSSRPAAGGFRFEHQQSEQTHIGIAYAAPPETHDDYYLVRLAVEVLGGGMSGRLFTEVREKRGLVYGVSAGYSSLKDSGCITAYAGTSNDRAQATLDCLVAELHRLSQGVTDAELARAKIRIKSSLIMSGESTSSRSASIAHDYFTRGRIRPLEEIKAALDAATVDRVNAWLKSNPPKNLTTVLVGPKELTLPV